MQNQNQSVDNYELSANWTASRRKPMLLIVPDPELHSAESVRLFGFPLSHWMLCAAKKIGVDDVAVIPGLQDPVAEATLLSLSDQIDHTLIVVYEGTYIDPECLHWLISQSIQGESYTVYDRSGKPAAWIASSQEVVPSGMPMSEEFPFESSASLNIVRVVERSDRAAAERLLLRPFLGTEEVHSPTLQGWLDCHLLRGLTKIGFSLAQLEALCIVTGLAAVALCLLGFYWSLILGTFIVTTTVKVAALLPVYHQLMSQSRTQASAGFATTSRNSVEPPYQDRIARAIRPMLHGLMTCALGYLWIIETGMRDLASFRVVDLICFSTSGLATILSLAHARAILRQGGPGSRLDLPDPVPGLRKLGVTLPRSIERAPIFELSVWALAVSNWLMLPWIAHVLVAGSRLWRWMLSPLDAPESSSGSNEGNSPTVANIERPTTSK